MKFSIKIFTISFFLVTCNFLCDECGKCEGTNCDSSCCLYEITKDITKIDGTTNENGDEVCLQFKVKPNHWYEYTMDYDKKDETFQNIEKSFFYGARKKDSEMEVIEENKISNFNPLLACGGENNIHLYFAPTIINDEPLSENDEDGGGFSKAKYTFKIKEIIGVNEGQKYSFEELDIKNNPTFYHTYTQNNIISKIGPYFNISSLSETPATYEFSIEDLGPEEP